jgi:vancomycin resistance protein YoaR
MAKRTRQENKEATTGTSRLAGVALKLRRFGRFFKRWYVWSTTLVLLMMVVFTVYVFVYSKRILPHTYMNGVSVGGLTQAEARTKADALIQDWQRSTVTMTYGQRSWQVKIADLKIPVDASTVIAQAYAYGHQNSFSDQILDFIQAPFSSHRFSIQLGSVPEEGKTALSNQVLKDIEKAFVETTISFVPGKVEVIPGKSGQALDYNILDTSLQQAFAYHVTPVVLALRTVDPSITPADAESVKKQAVLLLSKPMQIAVGSQTVWWDPTTIAGWLKTSVNTVNGTPVLALAFNTDKVKAAISDLGSKVNKAVVNGTVKVQDGAVVIDKEGVDGLQLDEAATLATIQNSFLTSYQNPVTATVVVVHPDVRADTLVPLGIVSQIGTATTDFSGSPANRITNIKLGSTYLNGKLVKNGETFATIPNLTPIDASRGYVQELVILNNRTKPEYGGGLCQVSTTLFRSVLNAGLPIVERANHAYRVSYYEKGVGPGLDATVYDPSPDFRWRNDTGHAILVQSFVKGNTITFNLFGTSDGRTSTISAPKIISETQPGASIDIPTDTMYVGERKQVETAHAGAVTDVTYTVNRAGHQIYQQTFHSVYKPWVAQYLVGTKPRPEATPTPTPTATPTPESTPTPTP